VIFLRLIAIALRLNAIGVRIDDAVVHTAYAVSVEMPGVDASLILAMASIESDFDPRATSRPHGALPPYYCSILQTAAMSAAECERQRELAVAYRVGAGELAQWLRDPRCHGNVHCALLGHGCGNYGVTTGKCNRYPERVLSLARRLR
jgi:hypothetical protein